MTRPTPTQGAQSEAARVPRVSDDELAAVMRFDLREEECSISNRISRDLRDARQASRDKDATIADLERRLQDEREGRDEANVEASLARTRAEALQARLTEAEQRAATAERRGFEACRDAAASIAALHYSTRHWQGTVKQVGGKIADAIRALAPAAPQEGETTP